MTEQNSAGKTDPEFLRRLQAGDERAWQQLLDEWQGPLYRYLCYNLPNAEIAQDVMGDTWMALVQAIKRFDGNVLISTFIYSLASRKVADYYRKHKPTSELPESLTVAGPSSDSLEFGEIFASLSPQYREALLLRYHFSMSVTEVAKVIGRTYKATESLLSRGRKELQDALESASEF
ncbi:MAG: RNA polymerase sigma factor [Caldilineaceae bacterium]|nr:RNA polymerase sigma factor [Caldilineaceae bacterium]